MSEVPLEVRSLVKQYAGKAAVDGVSFRVPKGCVFCLLGPNGAGKTTTLEIAQGIRKPTSGEVRLFGADPMDAPPEVKRRMGVLPQQFLAFDTLTVKENLQYFADVYGVDPDIPSLLGSMGLAEEANVPYHRLSGGTRRRVGIVAALVNDPELIFLDEPTAGVDPASRRKLWEVILRLRDAGRSIVLTTHYMDEAERLADEVAIIHKGRIVARGTPERVRLDHGGSTVIRIAGLSGPLPERVSGIPGVILGKDGVVSVPLPEASHGPEVIAELHRAGLAYKELSIREPSLDDAFVRLVAAEVEPR
jgi:ABC-2 type transport system ATP-binding protein